MLDAFGICVSTGSACSSGSLASSQVLEAIGVPVTKMNGTVRFTVGDFTTEEDIDYVVDALTKVVTRLRELSPVTGKEGW
jgi:cysteine desulfurase